MTQNITVFQLAKEFDIKALELIEKIKPLELKVKNHMSELTPAEVEKIRVFLNPPKSAEAAPKKKTVTRTKAKEKEPESAPPAVIKKAATPTMPTAPARAPIVITRTKKTTPVEEVAPTVIRRKAPSTEETTLETPTELGSPEAPLSMDESPVIEGSADMMASSEETFAPSSSAETETEVTSSSEVEAPVYEEVAPPTPVEAAAQVVSTVRRTSRFSVIRVVSPEPAVRNKPLIVEEAPAGAEKLYGRPKGASVPKTFSDPELARTGSSLIKAAEDEESRRKKTTTAPRREDELNFKSTDYLRRERVYQPKKKKLSIGQNQKKTQITTASAHKRVVEFDTDISVANFADQLAVKAYEVIKKLKALDIKQPDESEGLDDWMLDLATVQLVAAELNFEVRDETFDEESVLEAARAAEEGSQEPRSAVVTIMGHVDHGKTSLLDVIRRARVVDGEAGGITQHIGAYTISVGDAVKNLTSKKEGAKKDKKDRKDTKKAGAKISSVAAESLTFLDTPGHAAFTSMRARGASVTDIVVLVVSAVDGVMPQTKEAIEHAKAAEVPIIVAVNKMDLPDANPDRIRQQLSEFGLLSEEWGGETIFVPVSAKSGDGVDKLLEMIQIQAELLELTARSEGAAEGTIIEAKLDKGRGPVATVLIRAGTLKIGDYIVAGTQVGKVRALIDDKGVMVKSAGPSTPVEILGLGGVPEAGDILSSIEDERAAKQLVEHRQAQKRAESSGGASLEDLYARMTQGDLKDLPLIIKADVKGSAEAIQFALQKLPQDKVRLKILTASVGGITESDVLLASASKAIIFGFNVRPDNKSQAEAERRGVQIKAYSIIYDLINEVTKAMEGMLAPTFKETVMGRAEVRDVFNLSKSGTVAGCSVVKGKVQRANQIRLIRDGRVVYTGKLSGLKRFKDDAREVAEGFECGMSIENFNDIKQGDIIEAFSVESIAGVLGSAPSASA